MDPHAGYEAFRGSLVGRFQNAAKAARTHSTDRAKAVEMTIDGMNLADAHCQIFFRTIGQNEQYAGFASNEPQVIAATLANYRSEYNFSPEASVIVRVK